MQFTSIYNVRRCNLQSMNSDLLSDASFCNLQCTKRANFKESEGNPSLLHWQGREVASRATFQTYKDLKLSKLTLNSLSCKKMQKDGCGNWLSSLQVEILAASMSTMLAPGGQQMPRQRIAKFFNSSPSSLTKSLGCRVLILGCRPVFVEKRHDLEKHHSLELS